MEKVQSIADRIRRLELKGARKVAIASVQALKTLAEETKADSRQEFMDELSKARETLFASRPTEPFMRNAVRFVMSQVESASKNNVKDLAGIVSSSSDEFLAKLEKSRERIAEIGAKRIRDEIVVFTHCHSSTVTHLLSKARLDGKDFEVICTETRPIFQGRTTAREMLNLGVKTTFIIDSAARSFMNEADIVIVGADAITSEGSIINKIGTAAIALFASEARVPFYAASELLKLDPSTLWGDYEMIEERGREEIWEAAPDLLIVRNPAFEVTRREFVHGIICEEGIIPPHIISEVANRIYPWVFR